MIKFHPDSPDPLFDGIKKEHNNSKYKILFLDWWYWQRQDSHKNINNQENFMIVNQEEVISLVKKHDICFFVIHEKTISKSIYSSEVKKLLDELDKLNVFYITLSEDSLVPTNESKTFNIPWFIPNSLYFHTSENTAIDFDYRSKDFTFNMLLGSERPYRTLFFELLGNEPYVYSTYFGHKKFRTKASSHLEDDDILNNLSNQDISSIKLQTMSEHVWRTGREVSISHIIPEKIYNNSHFDIITESDPLLNTLDFTTEKTGKPLSTGRFFIWFNSPNKVEYLRKFGFELQDYLCEYDSIIDDNKRLEAIIELIKEIGDNENYIKKIYEDTKDARMHNQEVFKKLSRNYQSNINSWMSRQINRHYRR